MSDCGEYKRNIFDERAGDGFEGGGYDWQALAVVVLNERLPHLKDKLGMDSESSMFCAYSDDRNAIEEFAIVFHLVCENESEMRALLSRAELDS